MRILAATRSRGKQREFARVLGAAGHEVVFPDDLGLEEGAEEWGLEEFSTFEDNARAKALYFHRRSRLVTLADDSGLEVSALGGEPGVRSKRWAEARGTDDEIDRANNAELLRRLRAVADADRSARYRCVLVLIRESGDELVAQGSCEGTILEVPRGTGGFGYDPLFFSVELGKTFGEASAVEKDAVSHRGRALEALVRQLRLDR